MYIQDTLLRKKLESTPSNGQKSETGKAKVRKKREKEFEERTMMKLNKRIKSA